MKNNSYSPDELDYDPVENQKKRRGKKLANLKKNEILKERGLHKDLSSSSLKIYGNEYFFNYELSWLKFNERVLAEALNPKNKLLERIKFIGIVCSNLDEFFQKRVGGLKRQQLAGVKTLSVDGMSPSDQLKEIRHEVLKMIESYRGCFFNDLVPALAEKGIYIKDYSELTNYQKRVSDRFFQKQIYPIVTPLAVDESHPFPFISNQSLSFAIELQNPKNKEKYFARIKVPANRPRLIQVHRRGNKAILVPIENLIHTKIDQFFPGMEVLSAHMFRVTRNASVERHEEEADDLLETIEDEIRERKFSEIVRLELEVDMPKHIKKYLIKNLNINWNDVYEMEGTIGLVDAMQISMLSGYNEFLFSRFAYDLSSIIELSVSISN